MIRNVRLVLQAETDEGEKFEGSISVSPGMCTIEDLRVFKTLDETAAMRTESDVESLVSHLVEALKFSRGENGEKDVIEVCERRLKAALPDDLKQRSFK